MSAALDDPKLEVRFSTVDNLFHGGFSAETAIPLLSKALTDPSADIRRIAQSTLSHLGRNLTADEIQSLEERVIGSPHELAIRIMALGYYFLGQRESDAARECREQHIFWLIRHAPDSETAGRPDADMHGPNKQAYDRAKQLWLDQVKSHPENTTILGNAANFFLLNDKELCESLLTQARDLEPTNPHWAERLGQLHQLQSGSKSSSRQLHAREALRELQSAERLRSQSESTDTAHVKAEMKAFEKFLARTSNLPNLAKAAFDARELELAKNYAQELLNAASSPEIPEYFRNDGNAIHQGHMMLGRIALQNGDLHQARDRLLISAHVKGTPQLKSFGPNMSLVKDLLERGERDVVLEYFDLCGKFWGRHADDLQEWSSQVRAGEIPDFGPNLRY
jgi:hypothetical protein